jgi:hypothetical protein
LLFIGLFVVLLYYNRISINYGVAFTFYVNKGRKDGWFDLLVFIVAEHYGGEPPITHNKKESKPTN